MNITEGIYHMLGLASEWTIERTPQGWAVSDAGTFFLPDTFPSLQAAMQWCIEERIAVAVTDPEIWQ